MATDITVDFTFDTPLASPAASQCGRVEFAEYHVEPVAIANGVAFPAECTGGPMTAQEKLLEGRLFDLGGCINP